MLQRSKKSQARGAATQKVIMQAATQLFAERGFKGTTVRAIVETAKTSMGSFYHHFQDKSPSVFSAVRDAGKKTETPGFRCFLFLFPTGS